MDSSTANSGLIVKLVDFSVLFVIERAVILCQQGVINSADLFLQVQPKVIEPSATSRQPFENMKLEEVEKYLIEQSLLRTRGNVSQSARELGLTRMAMRYRMDKYQL